MLFRMFFIDLTKCHDQETEKHAKMQQRELEFLLPHPYLDKIMLPEVKPEGFDPADFRKVAMNPRAI